MERGGRLEIPDLAWVRFYFGFTTKHGKGTGVVYLVPLPDSKWKAYSLLTCLDSLTEFPEKVCTVLVILWRYFV